MNAQSQKVVQSNLSNTDSEGTERRVRRGHHDDVTFKTPTDRLECSFIEWTMKQSELRLSFLTVNYYSCIEQHYIQNT